MPVCWLCEPRDNHPRVLITDMRVDYSDLVARIFSKAVHHECIFHALQDLHRAFKEVYGSDCAERYPAVKALQEEIAAIFDARTKRTAQRRFDQVMHQRETFVANTPEAEAIFAFLECHWPRLVNTIESRIVPSTNNATEQVTLSPALAAQVSASSPGTTRPSAALRTLHPLAFTSLFSRGSIASLPSPTMPKRGFGASVPSNWLVTTCRNYQWLNSSAAWPFSGQRLPLRSLSPMRDASSVAYCLIVQPMMKSRRSLHP